MSLYNAILGVNPLAPALLTWLGLAQDDIPRLRDVFVYVRDGEPLIGVYTRTGGGNRDFYDSVERHKATGGADDYTGPFNEDLRERPGFVSDEDDAWDTTFATFWFRAPDRELMDKLVARGLAWTELPGQRMKRVIEGLNDPTQQDNPEVRRAVEVGADIIAQIMKAVEK